jgi:hypothetical protein
MPYNTVDLIQAVAEQLDAAGDGQPPAPEDAGKINASLAGITADLDARDIYGFPDLDDIPDAAFRHLAVVVAGELAVAFGKTGQVLAELQGARQAAESKLRMLRALPYARGPARILFY